MSKRKNEQEATPDQADQPSRRQALKKVLAGGGIAATALALPKQWTRPVVEAIVVPAHAQTSAEMTTVGTTEVTTGV